ncbi:rhomboid family intramembrane serine protease, partial [Planctomycetota bacterium]
MQNVPETLQSDDGLAGAPEGHSGVPWLLLRPAVVTWLLLFALLGVHARLVYLCGAESAADSSAWLRLLVLVPLPSAILDSFGAYGPHTVAASEYWRLLFAGLLHVNGIHLLCNGIALLSLGRPVERFFGWGALLTSFVLGTVLGSLVAIGLSDTPSVGVGASAGVFALAGVLIVSLRGPAFSEAAARSARRLLMLVVGLVLGLGLLFNRYAADTGLGYGISNEAHLGGLCAGCLLGDFRSSRSVGRGGPEGPGREQHAREAVRQRRSPDGDCLPNPRKPGLGGFDEQRHRSAGLL